MAVQGFGPGDFVALAKFAWKIYDNVRESRTNFGKLNIDVECLLVSIGSLDKGHTQELVEDYIDADDGETREIELRALRDGLNSVIMPFFALFESKSVAFQTTDGTKTTRIINRDGVVKFASGPTIDEPPARERPWRRWTITVWVKRLVAAFELKDLTELRSRFAVQAANLNLFLTRLTHNQLQRQTELLTLKLAEHSLLQNNFHYSLDLSEANDDFRQDVASYVKFLLDGGKPLSDSELRRRKAETRHSLSTSGSSRRKPSRQHMERIEIERRAEMEASRKEKIEIEEAGRISEVILDDDARLKLAGARQRLADMKYNSIDEDDLDPSSSHDRPSILARRKSEQVVPPKSRRPRELVRSSSYSILCDICDRPILADRTYYRCESGRCSRSGDSFDVCKACYSEGENCPGMDRGICSEMDKVIWKELD